MIESVALVYSLMASFIFSSTARNNRLSRPHPRIVTYVGWVLVGVSFGLSLLLGMLAIRHALA